MSRPSISTMLIRPLTHALARVPGALEEFFRVTDLTAQVIANPEGRVPPATFRLAWTEALRLSADRALALSIAETTPVGAFGVVEYVCRAAPTLGDALRHWVRYQNILANAVEVGIVDHGQTGALRMQKEVEASAPESHELFFALVARRSREALGTDFGVEAVRFRHHAPSEQFERFEDFFGAEVEFGARHTELLLPKPVLDAPNPTADPTLVAMLLPNLEESRVLQSRDTPLAAQVRLALRVTMSTDEAQLEAVARRMGLTSRSLQRRLKSEGESFHALRDALRLRLAQHYLGKGLSGAEISFLLGFSEPSAFFRAFKRWTGLTPFEHRARIPPA